MTRLFACLLLIAVLVPASLAADETVALSGHFVQGGLVEGRTAPGAAITLDGAAVPVLPDGRFLLGFGREAAPAATLVATLPDGRRVERHLDIAQRDYGEQRIDGLPERKVTPKQEDLDRIYAENAMVAEARAVYTPESRFDDGFIWPVHGIVTGVYGTARFLNGEPRQPHYGIDIAAPTGTPVMAPADGRVTLVHPDMFFTGKTLLIDHGMGLSSTFIHMDEIAVELGQNVHRGEVIGTVGATGRATGPHLDWRINLLETRLDPAFLVPPMPETAKAD